jgi:type I restriction enzyme, R subunit
MAGNDTEGLRYATTETPEKYYLRWKEESGLASARAKAYIVEKYE